MIGFASAPCLGKREVIDGLAEELLRRRLDIHASTKRAEIFCRRGVVVGRSLE
jgi:hypothetical protein